MYRLLPIFSVLFFLFAATVNADEASESTLRIEKIRVPQLLLMSDPNGRGGSIRVSSDQVPMDATEVLAVPEKAMYYLKFTGKKDKKLYEGFVAARFLTTSASEKVKVKIDCNQVVEHKTQLAAKRMLGEGGRCKE